MKKAGIVIFVLFFGVFAGCDGSGDGESYTDNSASREVMGTFARSIAVAENKSTAKAANKAAYETLVKVDEMMSDYLEDSQLNEVNRGAFGSAVTVSDELFEVLAKSVKYSQLSGGAFDITIGPVVDLWNKAEKSGVKPTDEEITAAKAKMGFDKLILDKENKTVKFAVDGMRLDLGAIAKGYAIDKAIEAMKAAGAVGGMVDAGGDIRCFGKPVKKDKWAIGLQSPDESNALLMIIELGNTAIATSGDYQRFVVLDGEKYSHIMVPKEGKSKKGLTSVTVIANKAIDSDALATTVTVMGIDKGMELIESIEGAECLIVPSDPGREMRFSSGFDEFIRK